MIDQTPVLIVEYIYILGGGREHRAVCGIVVPQPGIEPRPLSVKAWSPNHWTIREFPRKHIFKIYFFILGQENIPNRKMEMSVLLKLKTIALNKKSQHILSFKRNFSEKRDYSFKKKMLEGERLSYIPYPVF